MQLLEKEKEKGFQLNLHGCNEVITDIIIPVNDLIRRAFFRVSLISNGPSRNCLLKKEGGESFLREGNPNRGGVKNKGVIRPLSEL